MTLRAPRKKIFNFGASPPPFRTKPVSAHFTLISFPFTHASSTRNADYRKVESPPRWRDKIAKLFLKTRRRVHFVFFHCESKMTRFRQRQTFARRVLFKEREKRENIEKIYIKFHWQDEDEGNKKDFSSCSIWVVLKGERVEYGEMLTQIENDSSSSMMVPFRHEDAFARRLKLRMSKECDEYFMWKFQRNQSEKHWNFILEMKMSFLRFFFVLPFFTLVIFFRFPDGTRHEWRKVLLSKLLNDNSYPALPPSHALA